MFNQKTREGCRLLHIYFSQNSGLRFVTGESAALGLPGISEYLLSGEYFSLQLGSNSSFYLRGEEKDIKKK